MSCVHDSMVTGPTQVQSATHGEHVPVMGRSSSFLRNGESMPVANLAEGAVSQNTAGVRDVPQAAKVSGLEGSRDWRGVLHRPSAVFDSRGASPAVDQACPHALLEVGCKTVAQRHLKELPFGVSLVDDTVVRRRHRGSVFVLPDQLHQSVDPSICPINL